MGNIRSQAQSTDVGYRLNTDGLVFFIDTLNPSTYPTSNGYIYDLSISAGNVLLSGSVLPGNDSESDGQYVVGSDGIPFFHFNGANASSSLWLRFPNSNLVFTASIEMIVSTEAYGGQGIFGMLFGFNSLYLFQQQSDGSVGFGTGNGDLQGISRLTSNPTWPLNKWVYVVAEMVRLGSQSNINILSNKIYLNGVSQPTSARGINGPTPAGQNRTFGNGTMRIANSQWTYQNQPGGGYQTNISCSMFRVYNRALTQDEITKNYKHLKPIYNLS